jgi:hypothetical protein
VTQDELTAWGACETATRFRYTDRWHQWIDERRLQSLGPPAKSNIDWPLLSSLEFQPALARVSTEFQFLESNHLDEFLELGRFEKDERPTIGPP